LYNILHIHSRIQWLKDFKKDKVSKMELKKFYSYYKYNIGGYNYNVYNKNTHLLKNMYLILNKLNDIEHGILRKNNNWGNSLMEEIKFLFTK
jgi:hypothetical protein